MMIKGMSKVYAIEWWQDALRPGGRWHRLCSCFGWRWRLCMYSDVAEQSGEVSQSMSGPDFSREHPLARPSVGVILPTIWNEALVIITYGSPDQVLEFLPKLFDTLRNENYTINESEVSIFLPCLVEQTGHNVEILREKLRELMKQIIHSYSAAKTFPYILQGLHSRNNRTRIECVDLVRFLLENHKTEISGQLKSLQIVANLTADGDGELRKTALNCLATGYRILGDSIWRYIGKLSEAQRRLIDERFKWTARGMKKEAHLRRFVRNLPPRARPSGCAIDHTEWKEAVANITYGSPDHAVDGMKVVCHGLEPANADPEGWLDDYLVKDADGLVSCLAGKVAKTFDSIQFDVSSESCEHALKTLNQIFRNERLAQAVNERTLDNLIPELLLWISDERVRRMNDGRQLWISLGSLKLLILYNAKKTSVFMVLIGLLKPLDPSRWPSLPSNESFSARNVKFSELVVDCLDDLTLSLESTIYEVDLDRIFQRFHVYLQELGVEEIRRRRLVDDEHLNMVEILLHEFVKYRGTGIKGHLTMVPIDMVPPPIILAYIDHNLQMENSLPVLGCRHIYHPVNL